MERTEFINKLKSLGFEQISRAEIINSSLRDDFDWYVVTLEQGYMGYIHIAISNFNSNGPSIFIRYTNPHQTSSFSYTWKYSYDEAWEYIRG